MTRRPLIVCKPCFATFVHALASYPFVPHGIDIRTATGAVSICEAVAGRRWKAALHQLHAPGVEEGTGTAEKCVRPLPFTPCKTFLGFARGSSDFARRYARGRVTVTARARAPGRPCP